MNNVYADTNIFLRFLTKDIPEQAHKAEGYLRKAQKGEFVISVLQITVVEILFHLEKYYDLPRLKATEKVILLIKPNWIDVEHKGEVVKALYKYKSGKIDFVDVLTWAMAKSKDAKILSFDHDFKILEPSIWINP